MDYREIIDDYNKDNRERIVSDWLKENGYDGLCNAEGCGCQLCAFMPCDEPKDDCEPGYYDKKRDGVFTEKEDTDNAEDV